MRPATQLLFVIGAGLLVRIIALAIFVATLMLGFGLQVHWWSMLIAGSIVASAMDWYGNSILRAAHEWACACMGMGKDHGP